MSTLPNPESVPAFDLLAEGVRRQLYRMQWPALRAIQVEAIHAFFDSDQPLLIMAETAGGKTEAAFLPILSAISTEPVGSIRALYVGPLKALINDQFGRLEELCTHLDVKVHRWHGDVSASQKAALVREPSGVLLITPESLESLLINRTKHLAGMFGGLRAIVIDEVHAFLEGERGLHLASLLHRIDRYLGPAAPRPRRVGLSATVGDVVEAQRYLLPDSPERVCVISSAGGHEVQFRVHGYLKAAPVDPSQGEAGAGVDDSELRVMRLVAEDLVEHCRTHSNLVFANAKGDIELYADLANEVCREEGMPETFLVHHGSLSREMREDVETTMKAGHAMTTICSSTLEMGIDIGAVRLVGQIGAPWSVSSFKQRLGRSGRRDGEPRRLRSYVFCDADGTSPDIVDHLPIDLLQTTAICELLIMKWVEPPCPARLDFSTLSHQIMSTIAETGVMRAEDLHRHLCQEGPFRGIEVPMFARLLRELGAAEVIEQGPDGGLILGLVGERLRLQKEFYAAFAGAAEYDVIAGDRTLGTLPTSTLPKIGEHIVFAGRRWQVREVDHAGLKLYVVPAKRRQRPKFMGGAGDVHPRVREEMRSLLARAATPVYLDPVCAKSFDDASRIARDRDLCRRRVMAGGREKCVWLTWAGTKQQRTLMAWLASLGVEARDREIAIECPVSVATLRQFIRGATAQPPDIAVLAPHVAVKRYRKYDDFFSEGLLDISLAVDRLEWPNFTLCEE